LVKHGIAAFVSQTTLYRTPSPRANNPPKIGLNHFDFVVRHYVFDCRDLVNDDRTHPLRLHDRPPPHDDKDLQNSHITPERMTCVDPLYAVDF